MTGQDQSIGRRIKLYFSAGFQAIYGAPSSVRDELHYVALTNVLDRAPDQGGLEYWLTALPDGALARHCWFRFPRV
jgi:hypothetical protein